MIYIVFNPHTHRTLVHVLFLSFLAPSRVLIGKHRDNFWSSDISIHEYMYASTPTVYPKKYAHRFCFAVLCCGYTLTDFPISIRLTSLALWQSNDCPSASKATLMNMDKYFMWIHYEWLHNHNKAKHNKTVCIFLGIYCIAWISYSGVVVVVEYLSLACYVALSNHLYDTIEYGHSMVPFKTILQISQNDYSRI